MNLIKWRGKSEEAFFAGYRAGSSGKLRQANPYARTNSVDYSSDPRQNVLFDAWDDGWIEGNLSRRKP